MNKQDRVLLIQQWNSMLSIFGRAPVSDSLTMGLISDAFDGYSLFDISKAITEYLKHNTGYAPTPAQIIEIIEKSRGEGKDELAKKAEMIYRQMENNCNLANDWIVADPRACIAIDEIFVSPQRFAKENLTEAQAEKKHQAFIKAYCNAKPREGIRFYFGGIYADSDSPKVSFLGDYDKCVKVARKVYEGRKPRLPSNPAHTPLLEHKAEPKKTPEQLAQMKKTSILMLEKIQATLSGMIIKGAR